MPARSLGCGTCVKRKIRCDRRAGGCRRCEVHGVACPGYRQPEAGNGFVFKDVSAFTKNEANKNYARIDHKNAVRRINYRAAALIPAADGVNNGLSTANAQRVALHNEFIQSYLPRQSSSSTSSPNPLSFMEILSFHAPAHRTYALQPALDSLGLVQLGSIAKDERLLKMSVTLYGKALSRLAFDLQREDLRRSDDVLATCVIMSICELFQEIAQNNGGWVRHIDGANEILKIRGPANIDSALALALYSNARNSALVQGIISRKASYMETLEWRSVGRNDRSMQPAALFYDSAIQVPGLLERCDALREACTVEVESIDTLLRDLTALERRMKGWLSGFEGAFATRGHQIRMLRPVGHFVHFSTRCQDRTLSRAYYFPSFHVGYMHSLYWICMHALRACVQQMTALRQKLEPSWRPPAHHEVDESEIRDYIFDLCRCMPFFCEPISGSVGHIAIFLPMRVAATYFGSRQQWEWLKWIGAAKATIFTQGLCPPIVGRPISLPAMANSMSRSPDSASSGSGTDDQSGSSAQAPKKAGVRFIAFTAKDESSGGLKRNPHPVQLQEDVRQSSLPD